MLVKIEKFIKSAYRRHKWILAVSLIVIAIFSFEILLSGRNIWKNRKSTQPHMVTPVLRPLVNLLRNKSFFSSNRVVGTLLKWDYLNDRMLPGTYKSLEGDYTISINSFGVRGKEFQIPKPDNVYRIVMFGGSTTFGNCKDDETITYYLENLLNEKVNSRRIEVINYGVNSKGFYYNARKFLLEWDLLEPDLVIFNNARNIWYYDTNQKQNNYKDILKPEKYDHHAQWINALKNNSLVFRAVYENRFDSGQEQVFLSYENTDRSVSRHEYFFNYTYYNLIEELYDFAHEHSIRFMMTFEPMELTAQHRLFIDEYVPIRSESFLEEDRPGSVVDLKSSSLIYKNIYRLQKKHPDVIVQDDYSLILEAERKAEGSQIFIDGMHMTAKGNRLFAGLIAQKILKNVAF